MTVLALILVGIVAALHLGFLAGRLHGRQVCR